MIAHDHANKHLYDTSISQLKSHDSHESGNRTPENLGEVYQEEELHSSILNQSQVVSAINLTPPHQTNPT